MNIPWYRAIWIECAELLDYTPWKWWKYTELNLDDIRVELVDIWHFGMSNIMSYFQPAEELKECIELIEKIFNEKIYQTYLIQDAAERLASKALTHQKFGVKEFVDLCRVVDMNIEEIYKLYMGKNVLNGFRQDLGYKTGQYNKIWNGKEDNYYMIEILKNLAADQIETTLYNELKQIYSKFNNTATQ
jgi:dimeric dUTPase (all-alpha-NTP-PPase superfamily)